MKSKNSLHVTVFEIRKIVGIEYYATNLFFLSGVGVALNSCSLAANLGKLPATSCPSAAKLCPALPALLCPKRHDHCKFLIASTRGSATP